MRVTTRRPADRQQLVFDWNAVAAAPETAHDPCLSDIECEANNGHER